MAFAPTSVKYFPLLALGLAMVTASCRKHPSGSTFSCPSTLYTTMTPSHHCQFGAINDTTAAFSFIDSISGTDFELGVIPASTGAYNTSDNCYYMFKDGGGNPYFMYRMRLNGAFDSFTNTKGNVQELESLVYDRAFNKFYCVQFNYGPGMPTGIAEVNISGDSFTTTNMAATIHAVSGCLTIDNSTGSIYYTSMDSTPSYIEKYEPGASAPIVITNFGHVPQPLGLVFNPNDHMLYAIAVTSHTNSNFIRINPTTGQTSTLAPINFPVNAFLTSATIDPCSNTYIISIEKDTFSLGCNLYQLSTSGELLHSSWTQTFYGGLTTN